MYPDCDSIEALILFAENEGLETEQAMAELEEIRKQAGPQGEPTVEELAEGLGWLIVRSNLKGIIPDGGQGPLTLKEVEAWRVHLDDFYDKMMAEMKAINERLDVLRYKV